ncbi:hypothetical protein MTR_0070s0030 [Medicago truncatula]|uniref:Reverse transcriptase zinc-binding domain-containing protein n=1 Tax=Medicago truncatula TaxID=3880 RepID=A0A072TH78_MEDTR|nr:hypothetical protein MTR_0070s0030 [Medicago truncatula]
MWIVSRNEQINMWTNNWLGDSLLSLLDLPASLAPSLPEKVSSIITNGQWDLPQVVLFFPLVTDRIIKTIIPISPLQDQLIWFHFSDGDLSSKHAYTFLRPSAGVLSSVALIWRNFETSVHLFLCCPFASHLWTWLGELLHRSIDTSTVVSTLYSDKAKISTIVSMSGHASNGHCLPTSFDINLFDRFPIFLSFQKFKDIQMIIWKPPTHPYINVNTDGSLQNLSAACGVFSRDQTAIEMAVTHHCRYIWIEGNLTSALLAFSKPSLIPIRWRSCWHNCLSHSMEVLSLDIFHKGNGCAKKLATHGHTVLDTGWWESLPVFVRDDFYKDRYGLPNFRFP